MFRSFLASATIVAILVLGADLVTTAASATHTAQTVLAAL